MAGEAEQQLRAYEYDDEGQRQPANDAAGKKNRCASDGMHLHELLGRLSPQSRPKGCV